MRLLKPLPYTSYTLDEVSGNTAKDEKSITWEWPYDSSADADDTEDGKTPTSATFTITVTATQLQSDPTTP